MHSHTRYDHYSPSPTHPIHPSTHGHYHRSQSPPRRYFSRECILPIVACHPRVSRPLIVLEALIHLLHTFKFIVNVLLHLKFFIDPHPYAPTRIHLPTPHPMFHWILMWGGTIAMAKRMTMTTPRS
jgi:hypothetical protein